MLELAVSMSHMSGGMLLIDEIENGLHHSTLEDVFSTLYVLAEEFDVQVVATTHSLECFRAARFALDKFGDEAFAYHRLDRRGDELSGIYFDSNMIETAIEHGFDVR